MNFLNIDLTSSFHWAIPKARITEKEKLSGAGAIWGTRVGVLHSRKPREPVREKGNGYNVWDKKR